MSLYVKRGAPPVLLLISLACASESDDGVASNGGIGGGNAGSGGGTAIGGGTGFGATGGVGGSSTTETCDQLDNDGDGEVDDGCSCTAGETQECYSGNAAPAEGCEWGEQTCTTSDWGGSPCVGASYPPEGEAACCTKLGASPKHELYDAFIGAYPDANMPKTLATVQSFAPTANGQGMKWAQVVVGGELIDPGNGGVIPQNIEAGRKVSHDAAVASIPAGAVVVATKEDPVKIEVLGGNGSCNGMGWGWGSVLYQTTDDAVSELVYLYIGYCANDDDAEIFQYSEQPLLICKAPIVPR